MKWAWLLLVVWSGAWGTDFYVSQDGSGTTDGSSADNACAGMTDASCGTLSAGDTLYLTSNISDQTYTIGQSGTAGNLIKITSSGGPWTWSHDTSTNCLTTGESPTKRDYIEVSDINFETCNNAITASDGSSNWHVHDITCTSNNTRCLLIASATTLANYAENWIVEDTTCTNVGAWGNTAATCIGMSGRVRNNIIRNNSWIGDSATRGVDGITFAQNSANEDGANNLVYGNTCYGMDENCADYKGADPSSAGEGPNHLYDNNFYDTDDQIINIASGTKNLKIYRNQLHDTDSTAILHTNVAVATADIEVDSNIIWNIGAAVYNEPSGTAPTGPTKIRNNDLYNVGTLNANNNPISIAADNSVVANNVINQWLENYTGGTRRAIVFRNSGDYSTATLNGNVYKSTHGSSVLVRDVAAPADKTFAQLQSDGKEALGQSEPSSIGWIDSSPDSPSGFRLTCASPLRNAGTDVGRVQDYGNRLFRIGTPSIGAWEHAEGDERCTITERTTSTARTTVTPRTTITPR